MFQAQSFSKNGRKQQQFVSSVVESSEMQEVQSLQFESAKLKAEHFHWSEKCSNGIQQMLAGRQQRHEATMQAYLTARFAPCCLHALLLILLPAPNAELTAPVYTCHIDGSYLAAQHICLNLVKDRRLHLQEQCRCRAPGQCCSACSRLQATAEFQYCTSRHNVG